jgi:hypothetical protein
MQSLLVPFPTPCIHSPPNSAAYILFPTLLHTFSSQLSCIHSLPTLLHTCSSQLSCIHSIITYIHNHSFLIPLHMFSSQLSCVYSHVFIITFLYPFFSTLLNTFSSHMLYIYFISICHIYFIFPTLYLAFSGIHFVINCHAYILFPKFLFMSYSRLFRLQFYSHIPYTYSLLNLIQLLPTQLTNFNSQLHILRSLFVPNPLLLYLTFYPAHFWSSPLFQFTPQFLSASYVCTSHTPLLYP